jgi:thymidylate synthase (FAD)
MKYLIAPEVKLIDTMGDDLTVVNAARVSFDKKSEWEYDGDGWTLNDKDRKLIKYLAKHNHWTPFGHIMAQFQIKAPVYVARQLVKHQVGLVWNEVSRRYVDSEPEFFLPVWREKAENKKQGSGGDMENQLQLNNVLENTVEEALHAYKTLLGFGVSPEQARMVLPLNHATEWYWSGSVAAFARVCKLRLDPNTQQETRDVAVLIDRALSTYFPVSWAALTKE